MRTTITLPKSLFEHATRRMEELAFGSIKEYVQHLIRQDTVMHPAGRLKRVDHHVKKIKKEPPKP